MTVRDRASTISILYDTPPGGALRVRPGSGPGRGPRAAEGPGPGLPDLPGADPLGPLLDAHDWTLSPKTRTQLPYEAFYTAMTIPEMSYDVSKRLMNSLRVHKADPEARTLRLCSSEFGFDPHPAAEQVREPLGAGLHPRRARILREVLRGPGHGLAPAPGETRRRLALRLPAGLDLRAPRAPMCVRKRKMTRSIYFFGGGKADGNGNMKDLLGGKGAGLAEMTNAGLPVPPGFTISTAVCNIYYKRRREDPRRDRQRDREAPEEARKGRRARSSGRPTNPLLVSVRSGAKFSMPGMMDTILNLGLNDDAGRRPEGARRRTAASPSTAIAASSRCSATSCSRSRRTRSSTSSRR